MGIDRRHRRAELLVLVTILGAGGCGDALTNAAIFGGTGATLAAAQTPAHEIEQTYYLGAFDPHDQIEPAVYRVRVRGQASALSAKRFASGWVRSELVDSLQTTITYGPQGPEVTRRGQDDGPSTFETGRRLMLFGPEGFREAPRDHRLVIVMGQSPEAFFRAVDEVLGRVSGAEVELVEGEVRQELIAEMSRLRAEEERLRELESDVSATGGAR